MSADRERILDEGRERLVQAVSRLLRLNDELMAAVAEVEWIRRDIERKTGVSLAAPPPPPGMEPIVDAEFQALIESAFPGETTT